MIEITLTQGKVALIDDADANLVLDYKWCAHFHRGRWYARSGASPTVYMHRLIMAAVPGLVVDHINGDGLDNRRSNLRTVTHKQNMRGQRPRSDSATGIKGVRRRKSGRFYAYICVRGVYQHLGAYPTIEDAGKAYDRAAQLHYGEFARLNYPE